MSVCVSAHLVDDLSAGPVSTALPLNVIRLATTVNFVCVEPTIVARWLKVEAVRAAPVPTTAASRAIAATTTPVDAWHRVPVQARGVSDNRQNSDNKRTAETQRHTDSERQREIWLRLPGPGGADRIGASVHPGSLNGQT